jgi:hypothetical protein
VRRDTRRRRIMLSTRSASAHFRTYGNEVRVQAVRDYYAGRGIKKPKQECCEKFLSKEQYMKVILKALYLLPSFSNS